jgi:hypothetical protein
MPLSLHVHWLCMSQQQFSVGPARGPVMHWLNRAVSYSLSFCTVMLIGADMCEHPLGSGHSENGSDCCRVFGESRGGTFVVQNVALQNWSSSDCVLIPCSKPARIHTWVLRFKKASFEQPGALPIDVETSPGSESTRDTSPPPVSLDFFTDIFLCCISF